MSGVTPSVRAEQLASAGHIDEAAELLFHEASKGDADSLFTLATWRIHGRLIRRDPADARRLLEEACAAGRDDACLFYAHFLANGTGGPFDWQRSIQILETLSGRVPSAAEQLQIVRLMAIDGEGYPLGKAEPLSLSVSPSVASFPGLLTPLEAAYLEFRARPRLAPSLIVDRASGRTARDPVRRSDGASFGVFLEDLVVSAINRRLAAASGTDVRQGEPLQILSYGPSGEFRPHHDAFGATDNHRIVTMLVYLTDGYTGGETRFLANGLEFRGAIGDALMFKNVTEDGNPDPRAEHAGLPVRTGNKVIASRWIRRVPPVFEPPTPQSSRF